jgi:hypothetical protein
VYPRDKLHDVDLTVAPPPGSKQRLDELGPEGFARWLRESSAVGVTETTFRDAQQSLLATRIRSTSLLEIAPYIARMTPQLLSIECWGGATYGVALRFLKEDPWERLAALREALPNVCLQMLLRGRNTVGYTPYPEVVTTAFVEEATSTGIDIFRIFDALNNVESMRPAIDAVRGTGSGDPRSAPIGPRRRTLESSVPSELRRTPAEPPDTAQSPNRPRPRCLTSHRTSMNQMVNHVPNRQGCLEPSRPTSSEPLHDSRLLVGVCLGP